MQDDRLRVSFDRDFERESIPNSFKSLDEAMRELHLAGLNHIFQTVASYIEGVEITGGTQEQRRVAEMMKTAIVMRVRKLLDHVK